MLTLSVAITASQRPNISDAARKTRTDAEIVACGPAGSMILYNGTAWHGHSANISEEPRRSIQGAFIRREELGTNWSAVIGDDRRARLSPLAKYLLALPQ